MGHGTGRPGTGQHLDAPGSSLLRETVAALWPASHGGQVVRRAHASARDYWVAPSWSSPRWLLPTDAPAATSALLGAAGGRARTALVGSVTTLQATGLPSRLPLRRLRVAEGEVPSLLTRLEKELGPGTRIAVRLGAWSEARTAVLRAFDPEGRTLAFGKVGIDAHGIDSVRAEASALATVGGYGLRRVRTPAVLDSGRHGGLEYLLSAPLLASGAAPNGELPWEAMHELATAGSPAGPPGGGPTRTCLRTSRWARDLSRDVARVADPRTRADLESALAQTLRSAGDRLFDLGPGHGDWTPWNMVPAAPAGEVLLWDWEHFRPQVPEGFDAVHHLAQALRVSDGTTRSAEAQWERRAHDLLASRAGMDHASRSVLLAGYLVDVNTRFVLDRQDSSERHRRREGWNTDLMNLHVGRPAFAHLGDASTPAERDG